MCVTPLQAYMSIVQQLQEFSRQKIHVKQNAEILEFGKI